MTTHKITAKVGKDGRVVLHNVPFTEGSEVEVILRPASTEGRPWPPPQHPMKGSVLRYDDPFEPACPPEEWEAVS